jgi:ribose transport system substrate-binding protein
MHRSWEEFMLKSRLRAAIATMALIVGSTAFADETSSKVEAAKAPLSNWPGATESVAPQQGQTGYVITCSSQGIGCVRAAHGVDEAGAALGWIVRTIDGQGDPGAWNKGIQSAIAAKANGIVLDAVPPMLVGDALQKAAAANIAVVSVFNPLPGNKDSVFAYVRPAHGDQGKLAADWVAVDSGGSGKVILVTDKIFPELVERVSGFKEELAKCGGCKIEETVDSTIAEMAQRLPGAVATALSRHPDVGYVVSPFDSNGFFANEGVRQAGKSGKIKVASYEGDPQAIAAIRAGKYEMTIADPAEWMGWQAVDELARAFTGKPAANTPVAYRLIDKYNAPSTPGWMGDVDFRAEYKRLWGLK